MPQRNPATRWHVLSFAGFAVLVALVGLPTHRPGRVPASGLTSNAAARVTPRTSPTATNSAASPAPRASAAAPAGTTAPDVAALTTRIAPFDAWLLASRRGENTASALGARLAQERRAALKELIPLDPKAALALAVPRLLRAELPPEVLRELETPIDAFGRFEVNLSCFGAEETVSRTAEIDGRRYAASVFGRRVSTLSKDRLPIHGIAIDDQLAIDEHPFRVLDATESGVDPFETRDLRVAVGGGVMAFASASEFDEWRTRITVAEAAPDPAAVLSGPAPAAAPPNWTFGEKSVLFIRAEFSDDPGLPATDAEITASMAAVDQFYRDVSRGRCSLRTIIVPGALRLSRTKAAFANNEATYYDLQTEARTLARNYDAANGGTGTYNPDRTDRYVVIAKYVSGFGFLGIASVGSTGLLLNGTVASEIVAHELGHNHGLFHSHSWQPTGPSPIGAGTHSGYGDVFDAMGITARLPGGHFNTKQKDILLYLDSGNVATVSTAGTYRLYRHDHRDASGLQAVKIGAGDYEFWLEYRQQAPRPNFPETARMRNGLQIRWGRYPASLPGNGTYLLDMTPTSPNGMEDAPLAVGESFRDITGGLTITPTATGGAAPREWIDVRVEYGSTGGNNRNPILAASLPYTVIPARTDITFSASAYDPDGDPATIRWDFGDGKALTIGPTVTHRFPKGGNVTVVCSAIDGRGGLATKTFNFQVDDPLLAWSRQGATTTLGALYTVVHDGRQFIAAGPGSLITSPDGITWTRRTAIPAMTPREIAVAGSIYVAVGYTGNSLVGAIALSTDSLTWRAVTLPASLPDLNSVAFGNGRFVCVGRAGTIMQSIDGATWTPLASLTTKILFAVHFAAGKFVIAGDTGTLLTSPDGVDWTNQTLAISPTLNVATFHRDKWIVGNGTNLWTSPDAREWTMVPFAGLRPSFKRPLSLGADGLIVPSQNDTVFLSDDGLTWEQMPVVTPPSSGFFQAAAAANGTIVLVDLSGRIFQTRTRSPVASAPLIAATPQPQFVPAGQNVTFTVGAPVLGTSYQWAKNGEPIEGATNATLSLNNAQPSDNGAYSVVLTNFSGNATAPTASLTVDPNTARLVNLSIRSRAGSGADVFTVGFVVARSFYTTPAPSTVKSILMRGIGPTLGAFGVPGTLPDPRIDFYDGGTRIGGNDDWGSGTTSAASFTDTFKRVGAFDLAAGSKDAAMLTSFAPKAYTVQVTGSAGTAGAALAELYDLDTSVTSTRLVNVSARAPIGMASDILIGGFVLSGGGRRTVLIRAIGPGLGQFGVPGFLAEPVLTLFNGDQIVATNTGWSTSDQPVGLRAAAERIGAFPLAADSRDSALLATLGAGAYTIQVSGVNNTTGVALMEIYEVP